MSDKEARALAAGDTVKVNGEDYRISPLGIRQLQEIQREAIRYYKKQYLETFADNLNLLPKESAGAILERKLDEAARWDIADLPKKQVYDVSKIRPSKQIEDWMREKYDEVPATLRGFQAVLSVSLDEGSLTCQQVKQMTGVLPRQAMAPYDSWWVTATYDGMVTFIHASLATNHPRLRQDTIRSWPLPKIMEIAKIVETLTAPAVGNM